ncbi:hypothetical protein B0T25DRAFT_151727 [Lasiosphaeria hispida]|uniref:Uncharacterized protein n=1 Tax=Lasiosphaeria hispida TaxID=260671 RepID=A0AAJ0MG00_9PEZI|nr:hypothetical protein B0T25DRAFT_151727 [Lasiosphaeria hispida]
MARNYRRAKFRQVHPRLFAFEGHMSICAIEEKLFGAAVGLIRWSKNASPLSRHGPGPAVLEPKLHLPENDTEQGQLAGLPQAQGDDNPRDSVETQAEGVWRVRTYPMIGKEPWGPCDEQCPPGGPCSHKTDEELRALEESPLGQDKIFTLIDTVTMTATIFTAAWPPQALIACGTEGGIERVLVCSYDWTTGTLFKEAVLRFPGKILESMHRLPSIRLGLRRTW